MDIGRKTNNIFKIILFNIISAVLIVLFWFIFYYFFENHGWLYLSKNQCLQIHKDINWEWLNSVTFFKVYFFIEVVNYKFTDLPYENYAIIQAVLDLLILVACLEFMERTSWFVPITGINGFNAEYTEFRAIINYFLQYSFAFFVSNVIMAKIHGIKIFRVFVKRRKE